MYSEQADTSAGTKAVEALVEAIVAEFAPSSTGGEGIGTKTGTFRRRGDSARSKTSASAEVGASSAAADGGAGVDFAPLRTMVRNAERLLHPDLFQASAAGARRRYQELERDNSRKQLSAQVELKVRAIYFDRVEPEEARAVATEALRGLRTLEDVKFLLRHAPSLFPGEHTEVEGGAMLARLTTLRRELRAERAKALRALSRSILDKYPERAPTETDATARMLSMAGRLATKEVLALSSDFEALAPSDFRDLKPKHIAQAFRALQEDKMAELGEQGGGRGLASKMAIGGGSKSKGKGKGSGYGTGLGGTTRTGTASGTL